ncbi:MAG TPA: amidohydrolase [Chitinophagaceae bacterium]|nr:amidohydrolase [Chitinophagaceae bacterium]
MSSPSDLTISLVQADLRWEDPAANRRLIEDHIGGLATATQVVVLPEMFSTGFSMNPERLAETMDGETVGWMRRMAREHRLILTGSVIIRDQDRYFNRLVWMLPNGQYGFYDKRHLFAYGQEDQHYTPGHRRLVASVNGWRVLLLVCYDLRFPVWSRQQPRNGTPEFDLIIYVANWPDRRIEAWKTLLQARAIENQCYVAGVNRVGRDGNGLYYPGESRVIDPLGEIAYQGGASEELATRVLERSRLEAVRHQFPFWKDADPFRLVEGGEES